jgi:hypothetical protein
MRELECKGRIILQISWDTLEIHTLAFSQTPAVCAVERDCGAVFYWPADSGAL